jgi:3-oxoacyl-[acyl-carrier protein] reductase
MDLGLAEKVVFVAGSSRGIGRGIARVFLDEGARVVVSGRDPAALNATYTELGEGREERVAMFVGDLTETGDIRRAHQEAVERWGGIDVLVCNVGSGTGRSGWNLTSEDWSKVLEINLWSSIRLVEVFLPAMVAARRGSVVFVGSIAGLESFGAPLPYSAAKAALERFSKDLARQVARDGVRVNIVSPGNILFQGGSWQRKLDVDASGVAAMISREVPMDRFGKPEEIGAAAAFLASDRAAFITGASLVVDGGQTRA